MLLHLGTAVDAQQRKQKLEVTDALDFHACVNTIITAYATKIKLTHTLDALVQ